jgi:hypothetical protein
VDQESYKDDLPIFEEAPKKPGTQLPEKSGNIPSNRRRDCLVRFPNNRILQAKGN